MVIDLGETLDMERSRPHYLLPDFIAETPAWLERQYLADWNGFIKMKLYIDELTDRRAEIYTAITETKGFRPWDSEFTSMPLIGHIRRLRRKYNI